MSASIASASISSQLFSDGDNEPPMSSAANQLKPETFRSILFATAAEMHTDSVQPPACFHDLNLDQIVSEITAGRAEYDLAPFFYYSLKSVEAIGYRHDVLQDLEDPDLSASVRSFAQTMREMRSSRKMADTSYYKREQQRWFLASAQLYIRAVGGLHQTLSSAPVQSLGFRSLRGFLAGYTNSEEFIRLATMTDALLGDLERIRYSLHIAGRTVTVSRYNSEPDYSADVLHIFSKFNQGRGRQYSFASRADQSVNHVEAAILDLVAELHSEIFSRLEEFHHGYQNFADNRLIAFDREVQFYVACLEHLQQFKNAGLSVCYPQVSSDRKDVFGSNVYDLALAHKLLRDGSTVVTNDFFLSGSERILVISGPNQGGKTTLARTFGQLHYLASIGCPVPGDSSRLFLGDTIFTHFEEEENAREMTGKLEGELLKIREILDAATSSSILIMNESFVSTTLGDALLLSRKILQRVIELDMLCVTVTFLEELASVGDTTVSMVSTIDPNDQSTRTYKVVRRVADGLAYARSIAAKYRLTRSAAKSRIIANMKEPMPS